MKKTLSIILAVALAFSLCITAFAEDITVPEEVNSLLADSGLNLGDISGIFDTLTSQISTTDLQSTITNALASVGEAANFDITSLDTSKIPAFMDSIMEQLSSMGVDIDGLKEALGNNQLLNFFASIYTGGKIVEPTTETETTTEPEVIPQTGSMAGGIAVFATLSLAAAAAFVCTKKK